MDGRIPQEHSNDFAVLLEEPDLLAHYAVAPWTSGAPPGFGLSAFRDPTVSESSSTMTDVRIMANPHLTWLTLPSRGLGGSRVPNNVAARGRWRAVDSVPIGIILKDPSRLAIIPHLEHPRVP